MEFPVASRLYPFVSDVMRDRYGINRVLWTVTTLQEATPLRRIINPLGWNRDLR
jgi:hypothetical protein